MEKSHFFAMASRMKYINRWGLMNNTQIENISEHSLQVAMFAHALAIIKNKKCGGNVNPEKIAVLALYHDTSEIITGDMPTPIKYYDENIKKSYKKIEHAAQTRLLNLLPEYLQEDYKEPIFTLCDQDSKKIVKAADKLSALVKCIEEIRMGNDEFKSAKNTIEKAINNMNLPELQIFMDEFLDSFYLTIDDQEW